MLAHDRVGAMRYPFAFTHDTREGRPYGAPRRSSETLREFLGHQGGRFQPVRYPTARDRGSRDSGNAAGLRGILRNRGESAADIGGILRGSGEPDDIGGELRGSGGRDADIAALLQGSGNSSQLAGEPRGRGQAAQLAAEIRGRGHAAQMAAELRGELVRPRREPCYHLLNLECEPAWLNEFAACLRAAQRPTFHELLDTHARRCDSDHGHCDHHYDHECRHKKKCCGCGDTESKEKKKEYAFKTKDVALRGKSYPVRKSFLADLAKFENDLIKFVDKKSDEELPEHILQLLIDFINEESCESETPLDLVGLNLLASNLSYKSAVEASLQQLKNLDARYFNPDVLVKVCGTITMSGKVDEALESWLKKFLRDHDGVYVLNNTRSYRVLTAHYPEVQTRLETLMGLRDKDNNTLGLMIM